MDIPLRGIAALCPQAPAHFPRVERGTGLKAKGETTGREIGRDLPGSAFSSLESVIGHQRTTPAFSGLEMAFTLILAYGCFSPGETWLSEWEGRSSSACR
jgi:hypothetical protein